jgi:hypothetical protein
MITAAELPQTDGLSVRLLKRGTIVLMEDTSRTPIDFGPAAVLLAVRSGFIVQRAKSTGFA